MLVTMAPFSSVTISVPAVPPVWPSLRMYSMLRVSKPLTRTGRRPVA